MRLSLHASRTRIESTDTLARWAAHLASQVGPHRHVTISPPSTTPKGGGALGTHAAVQERPSSNSAHHNALYAPSGGDQRSKFPGMMFHQPWGEMACQSSPRLKDGVSPRSPELFCETIQLENPGHPTHDSQERILRSWSHTGPLQQGYL